MDRIEMSATKDVIESMNNLSKLVGAHVRIEKDGFSLPGMAVIATMSPAKMCVESAVMRTIGNATECPWATGYGEALHLVAMAALSQLEGDAHDDAIAELEKAESAAKKAMRASLDDLMKNIEAFVDSENEKNKKNEEEYKIWE